jgi:uncharacterized protein YdeI (YjbR/CyaY-like superfamily)
MNTESVDAYLRDGCGRCEHYQTPKCKVHLWTPILEGLRDLLRAAGLVEEMKWGCPCYTLEGKNVAMIVALRDHSALQFFKGAGLADPEGLLTSPGPNSQYGRLLVLRSVAELDARRAAAAAFIAQAMELERSGVKIAPAATAEAMPEELAARLAEDPELARAYEALTPGRRRSHVIHVSGAKQSETRARRVDRCAEDILAGRGFNER